jgi:large subunit ribosomal protein L25
MQRFALTAETRSQAGKGVARKLRADGKVPAILYGEKKEPVMLTLVRRDFSLLLQSHEGFHFLIDLTVAGDRDEKMLTVLQDLEIDPVSRAVLHADFRRVDPAKPIRTTIPIHITGQSVGVREGGTHQQVLREVEVEALPDEVPENISFDISELRIGDSLHLRDIHAEGMPYTILTEGDRVVSTIVAPRTVTEAAGAVEEAEITEEGAEEGAAEGTEKTASKESA